MFLGSSRSYIQTKMKKARKTSRPVLETVKSILVYAQWGWSDDFENGQIWYGLGS
jgi:hypothetical protein